ncbi:universal stress protein [Rhodanobacter sp. DHG33]|uniref:universal stress protein n=1 Tax=Rhodanobacter sp. DHG33 TaxID=2775921 RepID=UPI0017805EB1|nr:universal stress protein [Rhodanobacter sp. DHG33]MBD8898571.1 universal stress protein [Rhodanobacter sp. DHG33]
MDSTDMFKHILIPIDDDAGSRRVIEQAVALAHSIGTCVTGLHVMMEFNVSGIVDELIEPPLDQLQKLSRAHADKLFSPLTYEAEHAGVACDTIAVQGDSPWRAIVAKAAESGCDLIVMASHGRRGITKFMLGSETQQVLTHTEVPVLVVH